MKRTDKIDLQSGAAAMVLVWSPLVAAMYNPLYYLVLAPCIGLVFVIYAFQEPRWRAAFEADRRAALAREEERALLAECEAEVDEYVVGLGAEL